jgi:hypothetical protein
VSVESDRSGKRCRTITCEKNERQDNYVGSLIELEEHACSQPVSEVKTTRYSMYGTYPFIDI